MRTTFGLLCAATVVVIGFSMTGCATDIDVNRGGWSEYSFIPVGDYVVAGTVIIKNGRRSTLLADLMREALELGAHDIVNIRIGVSYLFGARIRVATAVAIKYTNVIVRD